MNGATDIRTQTVIIGGGLSGLALALHLEQAGHHYQLIEARPRFGGRIAAWEVQGARFDLGPSWIWPGQTRIETLLDRLGLRTTPQWSAGHGLFEQVDGQVLRGAGYVSMAGALRIKGGGQALVTALVDRLDPARLHLNARVTQIEKGGRVQIADGRSIGAQQIVLALPPRLAADLTYVPTLPPAAMQALRQIPTWMAGHAKFTAVYDTVFWCEDGLSGDAGSQRGPLAEIHDASVGDTAALFGFVGVPAAARQGAGSELTEAALAQLVRLFGPAAAHPMETYLMDWATEPLTATQADETLPAGHPSYGMPPALTGLWNDQLLLSVSEVAPESGGLLEGALTVAERTAARILGG